MEKSEYLECGFVQNTHGTKGVIRVESWCNNPQTLAKLHQVYIQNGSVFQPYRILSTSVCGSVVLMKLEGINDMDAAEVLKNHTLYTARKDFPLQNGEYFIADMFGLPVFDEDTHRQYGEVIDVQELGGRRLMVVKTSKGEERLYPMVSPLLVRVDVEQGVYVRPIPGLLED